MTTRIRRKGTRRKPARRIAVITGTRAEYGLLCSVIQAIDEHPDLRLQLVVTGIHLLKKFGHTVEQIVRDGWRIDARVKMQIGDDSPTDQALGLSRGVAGIAEFCERGKTDIVVVLGDRIEAMAGALAGVTTGRIIAHIHGGDVAPGDFDDSLRHAITKLAHLHLVATSAAGRRVIRMGESADRVHCVGAPGLDRLYELAGHARKPKPRSGRALVVHHARGRSPSSEQQTMNWILQAVQAAGLAPTVVYPNTDRGHVGVIRAIETYGRRANDRSVQVVRSLPRDRYLRLLIEADVLVGNSSSGLIEAGAAGTAAVNIGPRQDGRQASGRSVVHAGESRTSIREALAQALRKRPIIGLPSVYGEGSAGRATAKVLARASLNDGFRRKVITY